ncbi:MAG: hypothetical protein KC546_01220 [Anaerolineae bacterium]|nr:hypothetical protein [Anaerolineae bacterium]MCA9886953.1 hypothetical protein [Anaerolineae bacterium]MCB9461590.1 hypothetical protein [Anaerolineaceae bacterium]
MASRSQTKQQRGPILWPVILVIVGVLLLLSNFLLLGDFNIIDLWPLLLIVPGLQLLLRGDILPSDQGRTFGITRGSVESGTIDIQAGDIDVTLGVLEGTDRLVAGQYAAQTRPQLESVGTHAHLFMKRSHTPWYSMAGWEVGLAPQMPWEVVLGTNIGQIDWDASGIIVDRALVSTGLGDIRFVCPPESLGEIHVRSTLGTIQIITPANTPVRIEIRHRRFSKIHADMDRYHRNEDGIYFIETDHFDQEIQIYVDSIVGDVYLI